MDRTISLHDLISRYQEDLNLLKSQNKITEMLLKNTPNSESLQEAHLRQKTLISKFTLRKKALENMRLASIVNEIERVYPSSLDDCGIINMKEYVYRLLGFIDDKKGVKSLIKGATRITNEVSSIKQITEDSSEKDIMYFKYRTLMEPQYINEPIVMYAKSLNIVTLYKHQSKSKKEN